ncbi:MAG: metallophosphoesterase, partial [Actinomycetota bacterium]
MPEILLVSDSHLSPDTPEAVRNWDAVVALVGRDRPDLVVHTGDVSLNGLHSPDELDLARAQLDRLPVPWFAVPGNHDIGDIGGKANAIDDGRRAAYEERIGPRFWVRQLGRWRLIGFDSQELLADEARGQAVIDQLAAQIAGPYPIALFQHRPLLPVDDPEGDTARRYITEPSRSPLRRLMARPEVKL